jgi:hypothetical protein
LLQRFGDAAKAAVSMKASRLKKKFFGAKPLDPGKQLGQLAGTAKLPVIARRKRTAATPQQAAAHNIVRLAMVSKK